MVGRTPEYLGKKIGTREIKLAALYILVTPAVVLVFTALAMALPNPPHSMLNSGPHGFSEVLYAYTSVGNNNGSAFAGLNANTQWYNSTLGLAMVLGRFVPMVFVLALAGSLARQKAVPATAGTLRTEKPLFASLLVGAILIITGLTYFPALALGPLAEAAPTVALPLDGSAPPSTRGTSSTRAGGSCACRTSPEASMTTPSCPGPRHVPRGGRQGRVNVFPAGASHPICPLLGP